MTEHTAYIGLGSNLGDREHNLRKALSELDAHPEITVTGSSTFITTPPLGSQDQPDFLNAVA